MLKDKKYLIIDGNYFAQRVLGQLNVQDKTNNLETEVEKAAFKRALFLSLQNLYKTFNNDKIQIIDEIIFCKDNGSWRKTMVKPVVPYWFESVYGATAPPPVGYKEQRKAKKEESPINYDNFYSLYSEFTESLKQEGFVVFDIKNCEGDDLIAMLSNKFSNEYTQNSDAFGIVFCTDGDLEQTVKDNYVLFRNIRSKACPNGEIVTTLLTYNSLEKPDIFFGNTMQSRFLGDLSTVHIGDVERLHVIKRTLNEGISIAKPASTLIKKSFCGDAKDNLFSPISWLSTTGTRKYGVTEKHLLKAVSKFNMVLTENECLKIIQNREEYIPKIVEELFVACKIMPNDEQLAKAIEVVKHNFRMNMLSESQIPKELVDEFNKQYENCVFNTDEAINNLNRYLGPTKTNSIYDESIEDIIDDILS